MADVCQPPHASAHLLAEGLHVVARLGVIILVLEHCPQAGQARWSSIDDALQRSQVYMSLIPIFCKSEQIVRMTF